jgi:hypothetical protein
MRVSPKPTMVSGRSAMARTPTGAPSAGRGAFFEVSTALRDKLVKIVARIVGHGTWPEAGRRRDARLRPRGPQLRGVDQCDRVARFRPMAPARSLR